MRAYCKFLFCNRPIACQVVLLKLATLYFRGLAGSRSGELPFQNDPAMCSVMTLRSCPVNINLF